MHLLLFFFFKYYF